MSPSHYASFDTRIVYDGTSYFTALVWYDSDGNPEKIGEAITLSSDDMDDLRSDISHCYEALAKPVLESATVRPRPTVCYRP